MSVLTPTVVAEEFCRVRSRSLALCAPLTPEDMMVQSCADASPAKWHLAHTTWFFETFILREFRPGYRPFHPDFVWLFNSYYNAVSAQPEKKLRASFSRPTVEEILAYRNHVDAAMEDFAAGDVPEAARERIVLGLNHEQQHQELLLTDVKNAFWSNPLHPVYARTPLAPAREASPVQWVDFTGGVAEIGYAGKDFCFDNETPRHKVYVGAVPSGIAAGELRRVSAVHGRRRILAIGAVAVGGVVDGAGGALAGATLLAAQRERAMGSFHDAWSGRARRFAGDAGVPHQLFRGRRVCALGGQVPAHGSGMGDCGCCDSGERQSARRRKVSSAGAARCITDGTALRRRLGVDRQRLPCLIRASIRSPAPSASTTASSCATRWCSAGDR